MTNRLQRHYGSGYLHFITTSCYHRHPFLNAPYRRDLFLETLEQVRLSYHFIVVGYVVMPEHVHLLISEPERGNPSIVMQALKQRFARKLVRAASESPSLQSDPVWQRRYYDFVVWNPHKRAEKLNYVHLNPVKRGLVTEPEQWAWSSYRYYIYGESGPVLVNEQQPVKMMTVRKAS